MQKTAAFFLVMALSVGPTVAQEPEDAAERAARSWLELVDAEQYHASWNQAATLFQSQVTAAQWQQAVSAARSPLGRVHSRRLKSAMAATSLPGAPDGHYVVLQFDTVFEHKAAAVETVTPMLDEGIWRVSGYFVR